jgi:hypothetical protein
MSTPKFLECTPKYMATVGVEHGSLQINWSNRPHTPLLLECMDFAAKREVHVVNLWSKLSLPLVQKLRISHWCVVMSISK